MEYTDNGVPYDSWLCGPRGMGFLLMPVKDQHTQEDVNIAKAELHRDRDVVGNIRVEWQPNPNV